MANTNTTRVTTPTVTAIALAPIMLARVGGRTYMLALAVARMSDGTTRGAALAGEC